MSGMSNVTSQIINARWPTQDSKSSTMHEAEGRVVSGLHGVVPHGLVCYMCCISVYLGKHTLLSLKNLINYLK